MTPKYLETIPLRGLCGEMSVAKLRHVDAAPGNKIDAPAGRSGCSGSKLTTPGWHNV
jgi:hypothetical protein